MSEHDSDGRTWLYMGLIPERFDRCRIYDGTRAPAPAPHVVDIETRAGTVTARVYSRDRIEIDAPHARTDAACIEAGELLCDLDEPDRGRLLAAILEVL